MNLSGTWKGEYIYGKGYPKQFRGKAEPFMFEIIDADGKITGTCVDNLVQSKDGNESYIIGTFKEGIIAFNKRYKFPLTIDDVGNLSPDDKMKSHGVDYVGRFSKSYILRKECFSGTWRIDGEFEDDNGIFHPFRCAGKWKMSRAK